MPGVLVVRQTVVDNYPVARRDDDAQEWEEHGNESGAIGRAQRGAATPASSTKVISVRAVPNDLDDERMSSGLFDSS